MSTTAIAFSSARSSIYAILKSLGIENAEIIMPAYTCVVVGHSILLSNNIPVFVDISLEDYNMDLKLLKNRISTKTKAVIATSLFGYPVRLDKISEILSPQS